MTTTLHPSSERAAQAQLLALPAHDTPWTSLRFRDENARLLTAAMLRQSDRLLLDFPNVPAQDYRVLGTDDGPSGGLSCGMLITLWRESPLCRGTCSVCNSLALALEVGGNDRGWMIVGICLHCAHTCYRQLPQDELRTSLSQTLATAGYELPSAEGLLSTNGVPHGALRAVLVECGEQLLPPEHYGFAAAMPDAMNGWANPLTERTYYWAGLAVAKHTATDSYVVHSRQLRDTLADYVYAHLLRTGRLPELDCAGELGLSFTFPMISADLLPARVDPAANSSIAWDSDGDDQMSRRQWLIDQVVALVRAGQPHRTPLAQLQKDFVGDMSWYGEEECLGVFVSAHEMETDYSAMHDDDIRQALELPARARLTRAQRIEYFEQHLLGRLFDDADRTLAFVPVPIVSSDGDALLMVASISGYSFSGIDVQWWGFAESGDAFVAQLREKGWVESVEEFQALPEARKAKLLTGRAARLRA